LLNWRMEKIYIYIHISTPLLNGKLELNFPNIVFLKKKKKSI